MERITLESLIERVRQRNPLPEGAIPVAMGLLVSGVATYVFLSIASHSLDAQAYSALGVLWSLLFAVGNGVMQPLEHPTLASPTTFVKRVPLEPVGAEGFTPSKIVISLAT